jgi:hypothetical protein
MEESRKKEEKRLGVWGTWMAETFSGMVMSSMAGVLVEVESEKTKVVRAKCWAICSIGLAHAYPTTGHNVPR